MWRPTNWQELIQHRSDWVDLNSLEAGADIILEALHRHGHHTDDGKVFYAGPNDKGWLTLIPDTG